MPFPDFKGGCLGTSVSEVSPSDGQSDGAFAGTSFGKL